jgi:hypothetical protein
MRPDEFAAPSEVIRTVTSRRWQVPPELELPQFRAPHRTPVGDRWSPNIEPSAQPAATKAGIALIGCIAVMTDHHENWPSSPPGNRGDSNPTVVCKPVTQCWSACVTAWAECSSGWLSGSTAALISVPDIDE